MKLKFLILFTICVSVQVLTYAQSKYKPKSTGNKGTLDRTDDGIMDQMMAKFLKKIQLPLQFMVQNFLKVQSMSFGLKQKENLNP